MRPRALRRRWSTIVICPLDWAKGRRSGESCDRHHCSDWQMVKGWIKWGLDPTLGANQQGILYKTHAHGLMYRLGPVRAGRYTRDVRFILRSITQMPHKLCEHQPGGCGNTQQQTGFNNRKPCKTYRSIKRAFRIQGGQRQQPLGSAQRR